MGDRGVVMIKGRGEPALYLYTHWLGTELPEIVAKSLMRALTAGRITDTEYLARIVFCEMLRGDPKGLDGNDGFGISTMRPDTDHPQIALFPGECTAGIAETSYSFTDFIDKFGAPTKQKTD